MRFRFVSRRGRFVGLVLVFAMAGAIGGWPSLEFQFRLHAGRSALQRREPQAALRHLTRAAEIAPRRPEPHFLIARAYRRLGELNLARAHWESAWMLGHSQAEIRREEWLAMAQAGQLREAEPHLAELLMNPGEDGPEICEAYVKGFLFVSRFDQAVKLLDAWERDYPHDPQPHFIRGLSLADSRNDTAAVQAFRRALELAPSRHDIRLSLAEFLVETHEYQEAESLLRQLLKTDPTHPAYLAKLGVCLVPRGEIEQARQLLLRALARQPADFECRLALGKLELRSGETEQAVQRLQPLAQERPFDSHARWALASALQEAGRTEEAQGHFEFVERAQKAVSRLHNLMDEVLAKPSDANLRSEIGTILLQYQSPSEGVRWLYSVLELQPQHRPTHTALAEYYRSIGNETLADQHQRQVEVTHAP